MKTNPFGHRLRLAATAAVAGLAALTASVAQARTVTEGTGFLPTFTGEGDFPDLDVISASAVHDLTSITLSATMAGAIGTTANGIYVWGIDRGAGTELLADPDTELTDTTHPIGQGIPFDAFIRIDNLGRADLFRLTAGPTPGIEKILENIGGVTISGNTISITVDFDLLPSLGTNPFRYGYNVWPREDDISTNDHVSDFLPDDRNFQADGVPEPGTWALMIGGFGLAGATLRRRRVLAA